LTTHSAPLTAVRLHAIWNAHENESVDFRPHIYHVASGTPVAAILRAARTPASTEVGPSSKHVTRRIWTRWPKTRVIWRGDSHYGREEAMQWLENLRFLATACSMHSSPRLPIICGYDMPSEARISCAVTRALTTRPGVGRVHAG
jgi:hypothetical protein